MKFKFEVIILPSFYIKYKNLFFTNSSLKIDPFFKIANTVIFLMIAQALALITKYFGLLNFGPTNFRHYISDKLEKNQFCIVRKYGTHRFRTFSISASTPLSEIKNVQNFW